MLSIMKLRFLLLKRDYKIIVLMMILSLVFTFIFGSAGSESEQLPIGLALSSENQENEAFLMTLLDKYDESYSLFTEDTIEMAITNDEILMGVLLKKDQIEFIKKSNRFEVIQSEISFKNHLRHELQNEELITFMSKSLGSYEDIALQFENEKKSNRSFAIEKTYFGQSKWSEFDGLLQGILGFTLYFSTFSMVFGMGDIVEDKRLYTWHRLLTTPVKLSGIIFGNLVFYSILGILQISMVFLLGQWLFGVAFNGQLLGVLFITTLYVVVMNGLGLVIATHVKDAHQLSAVSPIVLTAMAMIGGCMWPIEIVTSKVLLTLSYLTPHRWAIRGIMEIVQAGSMTSSYLLSAIILLLMASILIIIGSLKILRKPI